MSYRDGDYNYMTIWKWIGFYCLPLIPIVGSIIQIILILKWAFGSSSDPTLKSYCKTLLLVVLFVIISCTLTITINGTSLTDWLQSLLNKLKAII